MARIADPLLLWNSLGFSQGEEFFCHQPRRPPLVRGDARVQVRVLWLEAHLALALLAWLLHTFLPTAVTERPGVAKQVIHGLGYGAIPSGRTVTNAWP
jgi:hypothetical protein